MLRFNWDKIKANNATPEQEAQWLRVMKENYGVVSKLVGTRVFREENEAREFFKTKLSNLRCPKCLAKNSSISEFNNVKGDVDFSSLYIQPRYLCREKACSSRWTINGSSKIGSSNRKREGKTPEERPVKKVKLQATETSVDPEWTTIDWCAMVEPNWVIPETATEAVVDPGREIKPEETQAYVLNLETFCKEMVSLYSEMGPDEEWCPLFYNPYNPHEPELALLS